MSAPLEQVAEDVYVRPEMVLEDAIDLFLGDCKRRNYSPRTVDTYSRILDKFCDGFPRHWDVAKVTAEDCRRFLDKSNHLAPATCAQTHSVVAQLFKWLWQNEKVERSPMERVYRPRVPAAEDREVVTLSTADVLRLLSNARTWTERLTIWVLAYMGPRRHAVAQLRLSDYDRERKLLRFREKGGKTIWKPVPDALVGLLEAALAAGVYQARAGERTGRDDPARLLPHPDCYLIPSRKPQRRPGERDDRIIWKTVNTVADRCGVRTHVHALRAAFAVFYLEQNPGDVEALKELMGHKRVETTFVYLRRLRNDVAMERVLEWR